MGTIICATDYARFYHIPTHVVHDKIKNLNGQINAKLMSKLNVTAKQKLKKK